MAPKQRVTISLSEDILEWIDGQVGEHIYKDRSHAVEKVIYDRMQESNTRQGNPK